MVVALGNQPFERVGQQRGINTGGGDRLLACQNRSRSRLVAHQLVLLATYPPGNDEADRTESDKITQERADATKPRRIAPDQGFSGGHDGTRTRDLYRVMVAL